ncbi:MAG: hypothetical protein M1343_02190 [Chloroflexi bacterium]|nr:hypothetical protein [Chloroflexota bacterium]MDA8189515.1 hypothetical protein [Dehalococcoidales bacterium]
MPTSIYFGGEARLPAFVKALLDPSAYPQPTTHVELRQTHISYVFLTGQYAYKVKKAVNFGFLDYSTLAKRQHFCHEEVRLNSRLCREIYLGVVEVREGDGRVWIGSGGRLVDYAVKMVQLPEDRIMDRLLAANKVSLAMVERVANKLAEFYRHARTGPDVEQYGEPRWIATNTDENFAQTAPYVGRTIDADQFRSIRNYTDEFLRKHYALFQQRIAQGFVRDGHGDLRAENVCFVDGLCIFDCVEFNERLRCGDVVSDIAFLAMDLDRVGRLDLSSSFFEAHIAASGDARAREVLDFYKIYRAYVRGKVESFKLDEPEIPEVEKRRSQEAARSYFELATRYARR